MCPAEIRDDGTVVIAVRPGADYGALDELAFVYGQEVKAVEATAAEVEAMVERLVLGADRGIELEHASPDDDLSTDVRDLANQPPVIRYVNLLVRDAYDAGASDLHLTATRSGLSVRMRLDGVLTPAADPPAGLHGAVVSRLKLLAELDIAEKRKPQDGRIRVRLEQRELDLRVSTVPTLFGEQLVLRLLDRGGRPVRLDELGMPPQVLEPMRRLARKPHGMILVTGPTGSGKTTTLYAALGLRDAARENIVTVEDPIEYQLPGIAQVPVHRTAGVTFASALRSILRQDPDVVMLGEMRDPETAETSIQAAMTGHLVFSTLHTNDALGAIPRLLDLGIPEYLVASTVDAVVAQRLVRRVCDRCVEPYTPDPAGVARLVGDGPRPARFVHGAGCPACRGTGYRGRLGVFELLVFEDELRAAITRRAPRDEIARAARDSGWVSMTVDAWDKIVDGQTTVEEVLRVVQE